MKAQFWPKQEILCQIDYGGGCLRYIHALSAVADRLRAATTEKRPGMPIKATLRNIMSRGYVTYYIELKSRLGPA